MAQFRHGAVSDFTRGGQTTIHFFRMIGQVFRSGFWLGVGAWLLLCAVALSIWVRHQEIWVAVNWLWSGLWVHVIDQPRHVFQVFSVGMSGKWAAMQVEASRFFYFPQYQVMMGALWGKIWLSALGALSICIAALLGFGWYVKRLGGKQANEELLRGIQLEENPAKFAKYVRSQMDVGQLDLAGIPLPIASEVNHILLVGSPGTGKSTVLRRLMRSTREAYPLSKAIIYDVSGDLMKHLHQPGDRVFNPFDERSIHWSVWDECEDDYELDALAASLIPDSRNGDPFWSNAARTVFVATAKKMRDELDRSNQKLFDRLCCDDIDTLVVYLQGTEAMSVISKESEKTSASIRTVLGTYLKPLSLIHDQGDTLFSIDRWMRSDEKGWLWLTVNAKQLETLKPLITMMLDRSISTLLSGEVNPDYRFFMFADEIPSLNRLPSMETFLAQSRKYGGLGVLGFQNIAQMRDVYGDNGAESITGSCRTWLVLRCNDHRSADWASSAFGENEWMEANENISYGANEIRDGVSISRQRNRRKLALPAQVMNLPDMTGFLKLGYGLPIGKVAFKYEIMVPVAEPFIKKRVDRKGLPPSGDFDGLERVSPQTMNDEHKGEGSIREGIIDAEIQLMK